MSNDEQKGLAERVSEPNVPEEVMKDISVLEQQFIRAEVEQLRHSILSFRPLLEKRAKIISHPDVQVNFWVRVLSNAPAEIDEYITSADAAILGSGLKNLTVERFEVNEKGEGEPRSIRLTFEFNTDKGANPFFENEKLVKEFYWRKQVFTTASGKKRTWDGLVSEPVRINWKKDMDITKGLLDAACDLFEAEKKGGDRTKLPEFKKLVEKLAEVESLEEDGEDDEEEYPLNRQSSGTFFRFFGYRGGDVTAEQSATATKEEQEKFEKLLNGENVEDDEADDDEEVDDDFDMIEVFPDGSELAIAIAEDLWPNALKYYVQSFEEPADFDEDDFDDDEDEEDEEDDANEIAQLRPRKKTKV
ncbi:nucleosome assembly protein [Aspergillus cavernicola]|uniref:Nucleosome assembly protein n=1 Tax=Aspergillus cavernicola TaxID=176166 RepID=A0ABR4HDF0_9EURO